MNFDENKLPVANSLISLDQNLLKNQEDVLITINRSDNILNVLRRYDFSSELQRMSVLVKYMEDNEEISPYCCFSKGSPEMIKKLSNNKSIPEDYDSILDEYAKRGLRLLAIAYKFINKKTGQVNIKASLCKGPFQDWSVIYCV